MRTALWLVALGTLFMSLACRAASVCTAKSGVGTAAVVELFTSEGCSSCPPADRMLSQLRREVGESGVVIPLGLHVTYWDDLGWKDVFAQKVFDVRQRELVAAHRGRLVYTPELFVNGEELKEWRDALPRVVREINSRPAPVTVSLTSTAGNALTLKADVTPHDSGVAGALFLAVAEDGLVSHVLRGENGGATLVHDNAVRVWLGPFSLQRGGIEIERQVDVPAQWNRQHLWAVALVQDPNDNVLQAVAMRPCNVPGQ